MREVAGMRVHGTTGEAPIARFEREETAALRPLNGHPPFRQLHELSRRVKDDAWVDMDTNILPSPSDHAPTAGDPLLSGSQISVTVRIITDDIHEARTSAIGPAR